MKPNHSFDVQCFFIFVFVLVVGEAGFVCDDFVVDVGSLQPNQPGVSQSVREGIGADEVCDEVVVMVGAGAAGGLVMVVVCVVVTGSLQPNQPGVLQDVVVRVWVVVTVVVVLSSRQPHQPGVWHVAVRVRVELVEVE